MSAKTPFAGLEALGPGEPLSADGYAFQAKNPYITDLLLKIGTILHQHDAHAAMADPTAPPTVTPANTGGTIEAGTAIYVQYTLSDPQGGETLPTDPVQVLIGGGYQDPTGAPTATVSFAAGSMLASTPMYGVSVTDGLGGETALGPTISVTVNPAANAEVVLTGLNAIVTQASGGDVNAGWRLWRSMDGGATWDLMATGVGDTWTDDGTSAGDCSVAPLNVGTTGNTGSFTVTVPTGQPTTAQFINLYASTDGAFTNPCLLATLPITDAGVVQTYGAIAVQAGVPPAVSTCLPGANLIDPDTDMIAWPWKRPVATAADLPMTGNDDGDMRLVLDTYTLNAWSAAQNQWVAGGGAVGQQGPQGDTGPQGAPASAQVPVNSYSGNYTLSLGDAGAVIENDGGVITIPPNVDVGFPVGTVIEFCATLNQLTFQGATLDSQNNPVTITLDVPPSKIAATAEQWATVGLRQRATDEWVFSGNLAAAV